MEISGVNLYIYLDLTIGAVAKNATIGGFHSRLIQ